MFKISRELPPNEIQELITEYSSSMGAEKVWSTWVATMKAQNRIVIPSKGSFYHLEDNDVLLDQTIAREVVTDFINWISRYV